MISASEFWNWFSENKNKYLFITDDAMTERDAAMEEFGKKLHEYNPHLYFLIGGSPKERPEVIITADGIKENFPKVEELVGAAPDLGEWKIIAFKPAATFDFAIDMGGITFDPREMWFIPLEHPDYPDYIGISVGIKGFTKEKEKEFTHGLFLVLDNLLGEKSVALDLRYIECTELPEIPEEEGFAPLNDLQRYIEWKKKKFNS